MAKSPTAPLYADLDRIVSGGGEPEPQDLARITRICDKILKIAPHDVDALRTKVVALIKLERYADAAHTLQSFNESTAGGASIELLFEEAYCHYRTNALDESLAAVERALSVPGIQRTALYTHLLHLEAQVLYRLERFTECLSSVYPKLLELATAASDDVSDLVCNAMAAHASLTLVGGPEAAALAEHLVPKADAETYEMLYNQACGALARHAYDDAERLLKRAQKLCRDTLVESGDFDEADVERELAIVAAQLAFVYQHQGRTQQAVEQYNAVLKIKGIDSAILAVASNNLMAIRGTSHELFESAKSLRLATTPEVMPKLNSVQRRTVSINGALLSIHLGKTAVARDQIAALEEAYPDHDGVLLARAGLSYRQKKSMAALHDEIHDIAEKHPDSVHAQLSLLQVLLNQGLWDASLALIETLVPRPAFKSLRPGLISLLSWMHGKKGDHAAALAVLESAAKSAGSGSGPGAADAGLVFQLAAFKLRLARYKEAAADYLQLVKADPLDARALAGLVMASAHTDAATAEKYGERLVTLVGSAAAAGSTDGDFDIDALEAAVVKRKNKAAADDSAMAVDMPKKKRVRRKILPKNYDPSVAPDPERWIPKRLRTAFARKGKGKREALKGPQGMALEGGGIGSTGSARIAGLSKTAAAAVAATAPPAAVTAPVPAPARPASPANANKNKNKKRK